MDVITGFWVSASIAVLLIGFGVAYCCWHVVLTLRHVREALLPNVDLTLTELQRNLNRIDELAKDVDVTVEEANQLVHSANRTVQTVEDGIGRFNKNVALPTMIAIASAREGLKAAWRSYAARREARRTGTGGQVIHLAESEEPGPALV